MDFMSVFLPVLILGVVIVAVLVVVATVASAVSAAAVEDDEEEIDLVQMLIEEIQKSKANDQSKKD